MPVKNGFSFFLLLVFSFFSLFPVFSQGFDGSDDFYGDEDFIFLEDEDGLTVTGTQETTQQLEIIEKAEIEASNAPDLGALLQDTLNIGITRYGGRGNNFSNINVRGFDSTRIAILVDGIPVNSAIGGDVDLDQIDLNSVERIEVIYGGSDSKYNVSAALGGVINIITVKQEEPGLRFGVSASNTSNLPGQYRSRQGAAEGPAWEDLVDAQNLGFDAAFGTEGFSFTANAFANRAGNHFLYPDFLGYTRRKNHNDMWDTGAKASFVWDFPSLTKVIASSNVFYADKHIPESTSGASQRNFSTRHSLLLDMPRAFHDDLAAEASLTYTFTDHVYDPLAGMTTDHDMHSGAAINRWSWYPAAGFVLRVGFDYRFLYLDSTVLGNRNRHDGGVYATLEWNPVESLLITPSVKGIAASGEAGGIMPIPKLGLLWTVNDSLTLKNNYFRSFKFPDFEDLYWTNDGMVAGNPALLPEDGWGADLGAAWQCADLFTLDSTFFTQWTTNSIHWFQGGDAIWRPENVGEAMLFGLDTKLNFGIPVSLWAIQELNVALSYQVLLSYLLSYGYSFASNKRIPYMPVHTVGVSVEVPWDSGSFSVSAHFEDTRYADTGNYTRLKPYVLLNANLNQSIGENVTVFALARNILNQSYELYDDNPLPGFSLTLGLKAKFGAL